MHPPYEGTAAPRGNGPETNEPAREVPGESVAAAANLERRIAEQQAQIVALETRRRQLETIINSTPAVIYMKDADGRYLLVNRTFSQLFHVGIEEVAGRTDQELFPAEIAAEFRANDLDVLASGHPARFEEVAPHDDGPHTYISLKVPIVDPASGAVAVYGISTDITEGKRAESALKDSQALYSSLVETLPVAMFRKDLSGRFTFINERFCQIVGRGEDELLGRTDFDVFPAEMAEKYRADDEQVMRDEIVCDEIEAHDQRDGQRRYMHVIKSPVYDARRHVIGAQGLFWDETDRRLAEQALRRMAVELARSNRDLEHFAYVASHDLQEPLRKVQSYGERATARGADAMDATTRDYLQRMVAGAVRMKTMIDDLLALARVTTDRRPFEPVDLHELVQGVLDDWDVTIKELGATVALDVLPTVEADRAQMRQLFQNLLGNALKYRRVDLPPRIEIRGRMLDASPADIAPREECELRLIDNGIGFDDRYRDKIFQPFERLHSSDQISGSGIGLAICRRIVERHHGSISATSAPGHGATFVVVLPVRQGAAEPVLHAAV